VLHVGLSFKGFPLGGFVQSRFGELEISEAGYEGLLSEADERYSKYSDYLSNVLKIVIEDRIRKLSVIA